MIPEKAIKPIIKNGRDNTEIAVGTLIAYGVFPHTTEGIEKAKKLIEESENWLVPSQLPDYYDGIDSDLIVGRETPGILSIRRKLKEFYKISAGTEEFIDTTVYTPADKFVDDGKEFAVKIETDLEDALEKTSDEIMDSIDEILRQDQEKFEEFKRKQEEELKKKIEKLNTPERVSQELTIKIPPAHYIQGTAGRWQPEFENDIDHAVYFAGKSSLPKGAKQREVLDWLKSLGLTFEQIHNHREKVLDQIRETISLPGVEEEYPYVYIDAVDQDFVLEDDEEDYEDLEEDFDGLDDLLNEVRNEEQISEKEVADNIEEEIIDAAEDEEDPMADADVDIQAILDGDENETKSITEKLTDTINKPKKESSYASNKKILDSITVNFGRIQETLNIVNRNLEEQNTLIRANIDTQLAVGDLISNQTDLLASKFDLILEHFERQLQHSEELDEAEKRKANESKLEAQRDAAGSSDFRDLTQGGGKSKRQSKIGLYYRRKLLRKLYRKTPKKLRSLRTKARKLQRVPDKLKTSAANRVTQMLPKRAGKAVGNLRSVKSVGTRLPGVRQAFAAWEYSDRKAAGQSDVQALAGVGAGLGGAAAGGAAGAATGAAIGAALGLPFFGIGAAPGAAIGSAIGGILGLVGGFFAGNAASDAADKLTGADQIDNQYETGGLTKPGTAILHGTEAIINRDAIDMSPLNTLGGIMIASTTEYINSAGAVAAPIAPSLRGVSTQMARQYDVPATLAQTNVGGTLPKIDNELKKVREKRTGGDQEEFSGQEKQLLETTDEDNFAEKLLKMIDPDEKFLSILKNINNRNPLLPPEDYDGTGIDGDLEGNIVNPMEGGVMEDYPGAKFGASRDGGKRKHKGRDLVGPPGMKVVSALPGTVTGIIDVGKLPGGGWSKGIYVKHSNGMETRYLHVHPSVKVGDQVKAGQQIAKITAMDDISSVPHLHFEVIVNGRHVDPEPIVRGSLKMSDIAAGKVPGLSVKAPKNPAEIENHSGTEVSDKTPPSSPPSSMATPQQVSSTSTIAEKLVAQTLESDGSMDGMVAATYGAGVPKTPRWMQEIERQYNEVKDKPFSPGTPKPGRGMGDTWLPKASLDQGSQIASLSRYEQESESNTVLINNQSSPMPAMPSSGGTEIIQMGGVSSSELLKSLMLQRLNA
jgi:murein DD-endopeptidase MepM/ murein hydrolase activator NlpD